jgi:spore germination protein GerM
MKEVSITFNVSGWVTQILEVDDDITEQGLQELIEGLGDGRFVTTIQEGGEVLDEDMKRVGLVVDVDNNIEYSDFEITNISPAL